MGHRPTVFISYSRADTEWKDRLVAHLGVLQKQELLELWDDGRVGAGDAWKPEIDAAIRRASVAVLLISADYLSSPLALDEEIPHLLKRRHDGRFCILAVLLKPCAWEVVPWLKTTSIFPPDARFVSGGDEHDIERDFAAIARNIRREIQPSSIPPATSDGTPWRRRMWLAIAMLLPIAGVTSYLLATNWSAHSETEENAHDASDQSTPIAKTLPRPALSSDSRDGEPAKKATVEGMNPAGETRIEAADAGAQQMESEALPLSGVISIEDNNLPARGIRVALLGTPCWTKTDDGGYFNFSSCAPRYVQRLQRPRIYVKLADGFECSEINLLPPPAVSDIRINRDHKAKRCFAPAQARPPHPAVPPKDPTMRPGPGRLDADFARDGF
ncbi:toll/interleukin-1 receptor domain-containing protein [Sorangium sp. So ce134]